MDNELLSALQSTDLIGRIVRVHLKIEQQINDFLDYQVINSNALESMNLDYSNKIQLALALGLTTELKKPLRFFGRIRNSCAHNKDFLLDLGLMNCFYGTFSEKQKLKINETASHKSLSWVTEGKSFRKASSEDQFLVYSISLHYILKIEVAKIVCDKEIEMLDKAIHKISERT